MASEWASSLPVVTVQRVRTPKQVTLVLPFYEAHLFFMDQMHSWWEWAEDLRNFVKLIVVDDGSPTPLKLRWPIPFPARLFRIEEDRPWNWLAARNIGAHHADDGWLLLTDIDHMVPDETMWSLIFGKHNPNLVYGFSRREHTGEAIPPHSASFFMTREMFWRIGGYDEALSGHYGTDGLFRKQINKTAPMQILSDELIRYEFVADSSTTVYQRKKPEDAEAVKRIVAARGEGWTPKVLSFPYQEVTCSAS